MSYTQIYKGASITVDSSEYETIEKIEYSKEYKKIKNVLKNNNQDLHYTIDSEIEKTVFFMGKEIDNTYFYQGHTITYYNLDMNREEEDIFYKTFPDLEKLIKTHFEKYEKKEGLIISRFD